MAGVVIDDALFLDIKADLDITWEDAATNRKVKSYIAHGMSFIDDKLGKQGDYSVEGYPRTLLFEYVRYARDKALDVFEINYKSMILAMQNNRKVGAYVAETISAVD